MSAFLATPWLQFCVFALGLAAIHAARSYAVLLTRLLIVVVILLWAAVLLVASLVLAPIEVPDGDLRAILGVV